MITNFNHPCAVAYVTNTTEIKDNNNYTTQHVYISLYTSYALLFQLNLYTLILHIKSTSDITSSMATLPERKPTNEISKQVMIT